MKQAFSVRFLFAFLALFCVSQSAHADNQIDKVVFLAGQTPSRPGVPSVRQSGASVVGTVDFYPTAINLWFWTGSQWVFASGTNTSIQYSAADSQLYGRPVYRFAVSGMANGSFPLQVIDADFYNPSTRAWVKMSNTDGFVYLSNDRLTKPTF